MAGSVNKVILVGNVGKDPEIRTTTAGKEVASFPLATSESWKDKLTGERQDKTEWHRVTIFSSGLVEIAKNYVKLGTKVYLEGTLRTSKWKGEDGIERYSTDVVLQGYQDTLTLLSKREDIDVNASSNSAPFDPRNESSTKKGEDMGELPELDEEVPF